MAGLICQAYNGSIEIEATGSQGTTIRIVLPVFKEPESQPCSLRTDPMRPIVLLVDNDPRILDTWGRLLEAQGCDVLKAGSVEDAYRTLRERRVHLAILDIRLIDDDDENDLSGLNLAREPEFLRLPKIMLSAFDEASYIIKALQPDGTGRAVAAGYALKKDGWNGLRPGPGAGARAAGPAELGFVHPLDRTPGHQRSPTGGPDPTGVAGRRGGRAGGGGGRSVPQALVRGPAVDPGPAAVASRWAHGPDGCGVRGRSPRAAGGRHVRPGGRHRGGAGATQGPRPQSLDRGARAGQVRCHDARRRPALPARGGQPRRRQMLRGVLSREVGGADQSGPAEPVRRHAGALAREPTHCGAA